MLGHFRPVCVNRISMKEIIAVGCGCHRECEGEDFCGCEDEARKIIRLVRENDAP